MGIEQIPLRKPEQWSAAWFQEFILRVLGPMDTRNALGVGIDVSSNGNSVATLDATQAVDDAIAEHDALASAHAVAFTAYDAPEDGLEYVRRDGEWIPEIAIRLNDDTYLGLNDGSYLFLN